MAFGVRIPEAKLPLSAFEKGFVSHFVSPDEIYVQCQLRDVKPLKEVQERIQVQCPLMDENIDLPDHLEDLVGTCWAARFSVDNKWYRAQVLEIIEPKEVIKDLEDLSLVKIIVKYIDYGNDEDMTIGDLRQLPEDLLGVPAHAIKCHLAYIKPVAKKWTQKALDTLNLLTYFTDQEHEKWPVLLHVLCRENKDSLKVFIWNKDASRIETDVVLLNARFVIDGLAVTDIEDWVDEYLKERSKKSELKVSSCRIANVAYRKLVSIKSIDESKRGRNDHPRFNKKTSPSTSNGTKFTNGSDEDALLKDWNPMVEHFSKATNTYAYNEDDINTHLFGYSLASTRGVCRNYYLNGKCKYGDYCTKKHINIADDHTLDQEEVCLTTVCESFVINPSEIIDVKLTAVHSPGSFYCVPSSKRKCQIGEIKLADYDIMSRNMTRYYRQSHVKENVQIFPSIGSLVAFRNPSNKAFERGIVLEILTGDEECLIHCIDTGYDYEISRKNIYTLHNSFAVLPPIAIHCSLHNLIPKSNNTYIWNHDAIKTFKSIVNRLSKPKILVKSTDSSEKTEVELFHDEDTSIFVAQELVKSGVAEYYDE